VTTFLSGFGAYSFLIRDSLVLVLVAISIYVMLNAGLFAVPQIGFMSIGAYTSALLSIHLHLSLYLALLGGAAAGAACGVLLGAVLARLDGVYLAIATIAFTEMLRVTIQNLHITGGPVGLVGIDRSLNDLHIVGVLILAVGIFVLVGRSRFGSAMTAMRSDQLMAAHQGVNIRAFRVVLFTVSGLLAGLAGGMEVHLTGYVEPSGFSFELLVTLLTAAIVGGMTSITGPLVGSVVVFGLGQALLSLKGYASLVNGTLIVLIIAFLPSGLVPMLIGVVRVAIAFIRKSLPTSRIRQATEPAVEVDLLTIATPRRRSPVTALDSWRAEPDGQRGSASSEVVLQVDRLGKYFGGIRAVENVSFEVRREEILGLIGPNGSGKTTVLNLLSGVYLPNSGTGRLAGSEMAGLWGRPERLNRAGIARTFQNIRLVDDRSVAENVRMGAYLHTERPVNGSVAADGSHPDPASVADSVATALDRVGVTRLAGDRVGSLPYGLKRKVEIARALIRHPQVLLLDEPTAGMTPLERDEIFELCHSIRLEGTAVVVVEHDVSSITKYCHRVAVLNFGSVIAIGDPREVVEQEVVLDAYIGRAARAH
jgi:branched-chain amino acid transport system permease protein